MRVGEKTHHLLSDYLTERKSWLVDVSRIEELKRVIVNEMKMDFDISKTRDYTTYNKDHTFWLSEHYYGEQVDDRLDEVIAKVLHNFDVFLASEWHEKVQHYFTFAKTVFVEQPRQKNFHGMRVDLRSIPVLRDLNIMAAPDFGVVFSDDKYLIIDWKTGQEKLESDDITDQLKVYALKTLMKTKRPLEELTIETYEVYLPSLRHVGGYITQSHIDAIIQKLEDDMNYQKQFLVDQDIVRNEPLPHTNFPRTLSEKKCATCTFRKVCEDLKKFE